MKWIYSRKKPDSVINVKVEFGELIKNNRYLNQKEKEYYPDYLKSVSAPQYEVDTQRKMATSKGTVLNQNSTVPSL